MRNIYPFRLARGGSVILAAVLVAVAAVAASAQTPVGNPAAKKLKNPVPPTPASVAAGEAAYTTYCAPCHGVDGKGKGPLVIPGAIPPDLTDASWVYGSSDGEIFQVIASGPPSPAPKMGAFKGTMPDRDIWNVVNFLRSLGPKDAPR